MATYGDIKFKQISGLEKDYTMNRKNRIKSIYAYTNKDGGTVILEDGKEKVIAEKFGIPIENPKYVIIVINGKLEKIDIGCKRYKDLIKALDY